MRMRLAVLMGAVALLVLPAAAASLPARRLLAHVRGQGPGRARHLGQPQRRSPRLLAEHRRPRRRLGRSGLLGVGERAALRRQRLHRDPRRQVAAPAAADRRGVGRSAPARPGPSSSTSSPRAATAARPRPTASTRRYNGGIAFYVYDGKKWYRSPRPAPKVWDGKWHHIAGTYDGKKVHLFVDGWRGRHRRPPSAARSSTSSPIGERRHRRLPRVVQADAQRHRRRGADLDRARCRSRGSGR